MMQANAAHNWAIVPVKQLSRAKQRLSPVLSGEQRVALAKAMLHDVLAALTAVPELSGILVVTGDAAAARLAARFGARVVDDVMEAGINHALQQALRASEVSSAGVLIVPADIPFVTPAELQAVVAELDHAPIVLTPASSDGGTNALAMRRRDLMTPCFGRDSFMRHQALARSSGHACSIVRAEGLGHDIDDPGDLMWPVMASSSLQTVQLLTELRAGARLAMPSIGRLA